MDYRLRVARLPPGNSYEHSKGDERDMDFELDSPQGPGEDQASPESTTKGGESAETPVATATPEATGEALSKAQVLNKTLGFEIEEFDTGKAHERLADDFEEQMLQYENTLKEIKEGEIVKGSILHVGENEVQINVGFKSEGYIPRNEFGIEEIAIGDEVDVFLENLEDQDGLVVLSKEKADFLKVWDTIKDAYDAGNIMEGTVDRRIKGGLVVRFLGVDAFLPGSQVALRQVPDLEALIGQSFEFKIIKLNKRRRNIVVSRRVVLEEERNRLKAKIIEELEKGQVRKGTVKNITDFGAFVDLGGIDGLLHLTDMSWGRISHPSELVNISEEIEVKVLDVDLERERISLGLKQLTPYPWDEVEKKYPVDAKIPGKVVSITDYGAFVELEKGVEGLIHISEMSWTRHVKHPSKIVSISQELEVMVLSVDRENEKISLGLKQTEPDPWDTLDERYPIGAIVPGKVRNLTNFGAFVELEEGIDGLVHISDMSWTKRVRHPREVLNKGDEVEIVILAIDKEIRRISLGLKQLTPDPWLELSAKYVEGTFVDAKVVRPLERGVVVEVEDGVEGFIPVSHLGERSIKRPAEHFAENDQLPVKVIKIDHEGRRIVLSVTDRLREEGPEALQEYMDKYGEARFHPPAEGEDQPDTMPEDGSGEAAAPDADAPSGKETATPTEAMSDVEEAPAPAAEETPAPVTEETPAPVTEETPAPAAEETPAPAAEETPAPATEEAPAPVTEETPAPATEEAAPAEASETEAAPAETAVSEEPVKAADADTGEAESPAPEESSSEEDADASEGEQEPEKGSGEV